jgi:mannosyltransferase
MFLPRYLLFTTPAWALLVGTALARLRLRSAVPAIAIVAALTVPAQVQLRAPGGHSEATQQIATVLQGQVQPGDAVVYADTEPEGGWTTRDAVAHYVPANQRPRDALATNPPRHNGLLLATECVDVNACLVGVERVWLVRLGTLDDPIDGVGSSIAPGVIASKEQVLRQQFQVVRIWYPAGLSVALLQRLPQQP